MGSGSGVRMRSRSPRRRHASRRSRGAGCGRRRGRGAAGGACSRAARRRGSRTRRGRPPAVRHTVRARTVRPRLVRTSHVQWCTPGHAALRLRYVQDAGGRYAIPYVRPVYVSTRAGHHLGDELGGTGGVGRAACARSCDRRHDPRPQQDAEPVRAERAEGVRGEGVRRLDRICI